MPMKDRVYSLQKSQTNKEAVPSMWEILSKKANSIVEMLEE